MRAKTCLEKIKQIFPSLQASISGSGFTEKASQESVDNAGGHPSRPPRNQQHPKRGAGFFSA